MRVVWDPKAKDARTKVANYIRREFGANVRLVFCKMSGK